MTSERLRRVELDLGVVGEHLGPLGAAGAIHRRRDETEVGGAVVGDDVEAVAVVGQAVFDSMPARLHHLERHWILGTGDPHLAGGVARQVEHEETVAAGPIDVEEKRLVGLEEDQRILDRVGADPMPVEPARPARLVQHDVEQRLGVVGPGRGGRGALDRLREQLAGGEVLHEDGERLGAAGVHGIGEQPVVGADLEGAHPEIVVSGRQLVEVQQDLFRRAVGFQTATEDRVLPAGLGPVVVEPAVPRHRNREILLLDPAAELLVEPLLKRLGAPHDRFGVPVLGLEIRQDLRIVPVPQPVVLIDPALAVDRVDVGDRTGERWRRLGAGVRGLRIGSGIRLRAPGRNRQGRKGTLGFGRHRGLSGRAWFKELASPAELP